MQPIIFTSRGRLDIEKGRARLLPALRSLCQSSDIPPFVVHIYGDGQYKDQILKLAATYPEKIFYHGRQPLNTIQEQLKNTHYALMPSICIESFGLSALESLAQKVPVIAYRQGGLEPFVLDDLNLHNYDNLKNAIHHIITQHNPIHYVHLQNRSSDIAHQYTSKAFLQNITNLHHGQLPKSVLLVSDYTNPIGGIETYLIKVRDLLQSRGVTVTIVGGSRSKNATWKKYLQMIGTIRNSLLRRKIRKAISQHQPSIVRYHSVLRNIGHAGIVRNPHGVVWTTYHDLGLMHPFPSRVYDVDQIQSGLMGRLRQSPRYLWPLTILKYLSTLLIKKKITKHSELHLVPSSYLESHITRADNTVVTTVGHFIE